MSPSQVIPRIAGAMLSLALAAACAPAPAEPTATAAPPPSATAAAPAGLPNPASAHCQDEGGRLEIVALPEGQAGVCVFADGSLCEEWAYFRDECRPGQFLPFTIGLEPPGPENAGDQRCLEDGGQLALLRLSNGAEYGLCVWPTGKLCEQGAVARGECEP